TSGFSQIFDSRNAGPRTLTPSGKVNDGNGGNNYTVSFAPPASGAINQLPITVTAVSDTKIYDGKPSSAGTPTTSVSVISPDTASFSQIFDSRSAGVRTLTPSGLVIDGNAGTNYAVTFSSPTSGSITPAPLTLTADGKSKIFDAAPFPLTSFTAGLSGFVNNEADTTLRGAGELGGNAGFTGAATVNT